MEISSFHLPAPLKLCRRVCRKVMAGRVFMYIQIFLQDSEGHPKEVPSPCPGKKIKMLWFDIFAYSWLRSKFFLFVIYSSFVVVVAVSSRAPFFSSSPSHHCHSVIFISSSSSDLLSDFEHSIIFIQLKSVYSIISVIVVVVIVVMIITRPCDLHSLLLGIHPPEETAAQRAVLGLWIIRIFGDCVEPDWAGTPRTDKTSGWPEWNILHHYRPRCLGW